MSINPEYRFVTAVKVWDRSCHKWPCSETDHADKVLNGKAKPRNKRSHSYHKQTEG